ncbi:MAG: hypothetical protein MUF15_19780, partial [Acidobacteria bacterium]|nr:hypothetical protein [Acidobacteriota bacterium]
CCANYGKFRQYIAGIYHNWRSKKGIYQDIKGLCKSVPICEVKLQDYLLAPARYVGIPEEIKKDAVSFDILMKQMANEFEILMKRGEELDRIILENIKNLALLED